MELCSVVIFGWNNNQTVGHTNYDGRPVVLNHLKIQKRSHHAGVDCSLLNITSNASHKCLGGRGAADFALPFGAVKVFKVTRQGLVAVQLGWEIKRGEMGVVLVYFDFLLHGGVSVVEGYGAQLLGGRGGNISIMFSFPSKPSVWLSSPRYSP